MLTLILALQAAAMPALPPARFPDPGARAEALGRRLAEAGTLAALLPLVTARETEELVAGQPGLTPAEQATLRATAQEVRAAATDRLMAATGHAYATRMSADELAAAVAFEETQAGRARRAATPAAIAETMIAVGPMDYKGDVMKAFCARTGKGCPAK